MSDDTPSPVKRALLIGIDAYALQPDVIVPLSGCTNDVDLMRSILVGTYGFDEANVAVLKNAAATRDGIVAAFEQLVAATGTDDVVVVQYAGHGSQKWNESGEEASGWDSTIVPVDSGRPGLAKPEQQATVENRDITDKTINGWLRALGERTPFTTLFFDSCHSGTITRDVFEAKARRVPSEPREGATVSRAAAPGAPSGTPLGPPRGAGPSPADGDRYVVISGCRDDEISWEHKDGNGVSNGALTYFLAQELRKAGRKRSYRALHEAIAPLVTAYKGQHPQIEGRSDLVVLGTETVTPMTYVTVNGPGVAAGTIELAAGAGHRVTAGSEYDVYQPGTDATAAATPIGRVRVTAVRAVTCDAAPVGDTPASAFPAGARAVEAEHVYGDFRTGVLLDASVTTSTTREAQDFVQAVARSRKLEVLTSAADRTPGVVVYLIAPRQTAHDGDPVPRLAPVTEPTWVIANGAGEPVAPLKPLGGWPDVAANLDKLANLRDTLALDNPDPSSTLRDRVRVELTRRVPGADAPADMDPKTFRWEVAAPDASGRVVFDEGEFLGFRIVNEHTAPLFVNLLALGHSGAISVVYPRPSDGTPMLPGRDDPDGANVVNVRKWDSKGFRATFSPTYPFLADGTHAHDDEAEDTIKLVASTHEARFDAVAQAATRDVDSHAVKRAPSPLESLLNRAYAAQPARPATRDIDVDDPPPPPAKLPVRAEDWTTVTARYVVRRAGTAPAAAPAPAAPDMSSLPDVSPTPDAAPAPDVPAAPPAPIPQTAIGRQLGELGAPVQQSFEVATRTAAGPGGRAVSEPRPVSVDAPPPVHGQMLLTTDPDTGLVSWVFAPPAEGEGDGASEPASRGGPARRTYVLPTSAAPDVPAGDGGRSVVSALVKKVVEVVAFPLFEAGMRVASEAYAPKWENERHPAGLRRFSPDHYTVKGAEPVSGDALVQQSESERTLLLVHGTFSTAHGAFGAMPKADMERLYRAYGGRVFALDHPTLSADPIENARWLMAQIPDGRTLDVDIVCHSRGGLVSRVLVERADELPARPRVGKVVFVGSPNAGTALVDPSHVHHLIDTFSNLLDLVPPNGVTDVLDGVLFVAKILAVGATGVLKGLPGLMAMDPQGAFTKKLNARVPAGASAADDTQYFAMSSNYTPSTAQPALAALVKNRVMDHLFGDGENDLVVPTAGVYAENGANRFPIARTKVFRDGDAIPHTGFFASPQARQQLFEWLGA